MALQDGLGGYMDHQALLALAKSNARSESKQLHPFWQYKKRKIAYERLVDKYYLEYTLNLYSKGKP